MITSTSPRRKPRIISEGRMSDDEWAEFRVQREQFERNSHWLEKNIADVFARCRGKTICVVGQQLFAADSSEEALKIARAAFPDDRGLVIRYIPKDDYPRIYAC